MQPKRPNTPMQKKPTPPAIPSFRVKQYVGRGGTFFMGEAAPGLNVLITQTKDKRIRTKPGQWNGPEFNVQFVTTKQLRTAAALAIVVSKLKTKK